MPFAEFDLRTACKRFGLKTDERRDLFSSVPELEVPAQLRETLDEWAPTALAINTEKARSEMIMTPILMMAVRLAPPPVAIFSGSTWTVNGV